MNSLQDTFGAAADAWDEDGHEELAKTFQDGAGANDFFDLGNNDLGKKCQNIPEKCQFFFISMYLNNIYRTGKNFSRWCSCQMTFSIWSKMIT